MVILNTKLHKNLFSKSVVLGLSLRFTVTADITGFVSCTVKKLPFSLCLPFVDPNNYLRSLKIATWLVSVTQLLATILVILVYSCLAREVKRSQVDLNNYKPISKLHNFFVLQLVIVCASNILCWLPSCAVFLSCQVVLIVLSYF